MKIKVIVLVIMFAVSSSLFAAGNQIKYTLMSMQYQLHQQKIKLDQFYQELDKEYRNYRIIKKDFDERYNKIDDNIYRQENTITNVVNSIEDAHQKIDDLRSKINTNAFGVSKNRNRNLEDKIIVADLSDNLGKNTIYWLVGILGVAALVILLFIFLRKQVINQSSKLSERIQNTREILEEEGIRLDKKLVEILDSQLKITNEKEARNSNESDHALALKVADEIIRIQKNLSRMDVKTKGLKQLSASMKRMQDNFAKNGYEIVEMLGKTFNEGMKSNVTFIPDDTLDPGMQVITKIIKPQVNYNDTMIQSAQIEVSQG